MHSLCRVLRVCLPIAAILMMALFGCQPAKRFAPPTEKVADKPSTADGEQLSDLTRSYLMWKDGHGPTNPVRIIYVHEETNAVEWNALKKFWTQTTAQDVASMIGNPGFPSPPLLVIAPDPQVIKIKVPRGLDDPTPFVPAYNPLTYPKWTLGRDLFYDKTWLTDDGKTSCASCHRPEQGFADSRQSYDGFNTPTLVNVVYNGAVFWDGRAGCLEEVFARSLQDELAAETPGRFRHTWSGAVGRLMTGKYVQRFDAVFATPPSQDAVAKSLATYLRTLLAGDSLYDRARDVQAKRKGDKLEADDFIPLLDDAALKVLDREDAARKKEAVVKEVADDLVQGHQLFTKLNCVRCHSTRQFTDGQFHNVGVGDRLKMVQKPFDGQFAGRSANLPIGQKDRKFIGAFKTPTLRGLKRTAPYFHDGDQRTLADALTFHTQTFPWNDYLDPLMLVEGEVSREKHLDLTAQEIKALLAFLKALNGTEVDSAVLPPQ